MVHFCVALFACQVADVSGDTSLVMERPRRHFSSSLSCVATTTNKKVKEIEPRVLMWVTRSMDTPLGEVSGSGIWLGVSPSLGEVQAA